MTTPNLPENDTSNNQPRVAGDPSVKRHIVVDQHGNEIVRQQHSLGDTRLFRILGGKARRWASGVSVTPRQEPAPIDPQILGVRVSEWQEKGLSALSNEAFERLAIERPDALRAQMYKETLQIGKIALCGVLFWSGAILLGVLFLAVAGVSFVVLLAGATAIFKAIDGAFGYGFAMFLLGALFVYMYIVAPILKASDANKK